MHNCDTALDICGRLAATVVRDNQAADFPTRLLVNAACLGLAQCDLKDARSKNALEHAGMFFRALTDSRGSSDVSEQVCVIVGQILTSHFPGSNGGKLLESIEQGLRQNHIGNVLRTCVEEKQK